MYPYNRRMLTERDLAYIAGVIDDRGNLTSRTVRDAVLPQVDLNGGRAHVLRWLGEITGAKVVSTKRDYLRMGCSEHCTERHVHIWSESLRWSVSGAKATIFLAGIQPHIRYRQAEVQDLIELGLKARHKGATVDKMRELGWPIPELR